MRENVPGAPRQKLEQIPGIRAGVATLASDGHPTWNEDAFLQEADAFAVFDGVGGISGGKEASNAVRDYVKECLAQLPPGLSASQVEREFAGILQASHRFLLKMQSASGGEMATTATLVKLVRNIDGAQKAVIANVGDSRVYVLRRGGSLEPITLDDSALSVDTTEKEARELQQLFSNVSHANEVEHFFTDYQRYLFSKRNSITQALGFRNKSNAPSPITPRTHIVDLQQGDRLLLSSDGIHDNLRDTEIADILGTSSDTQVRAQKLAGAAQTRSREKGHVRAKPDDMTAIVVDYNPDAPSGDGEKVPFVSMTELARNIKNDFRRIYDYIRARETHRIAGGDVSQRDMVKFIHQGLAGTIAPHNAPQDTELRRQASDINRQLISLVSRCRSKQELLSTLDDLGGYPTEEGMVTAAEMKTVMQRYWDGTTGEDSITRAGGLRNAARTVR